MAADIVNLNKARKAKARVEKDRKAAENRLAFGRSKADRARHEAEAERRRRELDGARREADDGAGRDAPGHGRAADDDPGRP